MADDRDPPDLAPDGGALTAAAVDERIARAIHTVRGQRVILDEDLADLYGVETKRLNEQVRRNADRFPDDFAFQLTQGEWSNLKSQIATSSWGGRRKLPTAFTEHGAIMAANVLRSDRAIRVSVEVVRAFVRMRQALAVSDELARKFAELEERLDGHDQLATELDKRVGNHDVTFRVVFRELRKLLRPPPPERRRIGFTDDE